MWEEAESQNLPSILSFLNYTDAVSEVTFYVAESCKAFARWL